jgi:TonB family protein
VRLATQELTAIRKRTRATTGVSVVVHALLLLLFHWSPSRDLAAEGLVEITWIEAPAPISSGPTARVTRQSREGSTRHANPGPRPAETRFERELPRAETVPRPQEVAAIRDVLRERLSSLERQATEQRTQVAVLVPRAEPTRPSLAGAPGVASRPQELVRGASSEPAELVRATLPSTRSPALARLQNETLPPTTRPKESGASLPAREVLAGVSLAGPVADRAVRSYTLPEYPEWAKREVVEGSVKLHFIVRPDGAVKENVMIEQTSGFEDFDQNATLALLAWRFEPLVGGTAEQWGSITLNYRIDGTVQ